MARDIDRLMERASQQIRHQNVRGAIDSLRQALSLDADHGEAHALLAICLHDERRLHAAEHEARLSVTLEPDSGLANYAMAVIQQAKRRFALAEEHFERALAGDPGNTVFVLGLAHLYGLWHRTDKVLPLLEKARELAPDDPDCWSALAGHYREARDYERAESAARRALELDPQNVDGLLVMGHLLLREGRVQDAREHALLVLRENALHEGGIALLSAVKARQSLLLGLWWRFNSFFGAGSPTRRVLMLVGLYLVYRVGVMVLGDFGYENAQLPLVLAWLGFCVYTWVGPAVFEKQLKRELEPARIDPKY